MEANGELSLGQVIEERMRGPLRRKSSVAERLQRKFQLGDRPATRAKLFRQLEKLVEEHGAAVEDVISSAVAAACGARSPGRYFCKCVVAKLREAGFGAAHGGDPSW